MKRQTGRAAATADLRFLFAGENRPSIETIADAIDGRDGIAFLGQSRLPHDGGPVLEVQIDGLTFDIHGLAPGVSFAMPDILEWRDIAPESRAATAGIVALAPGPHIAAGKCSPPVFRATMRVARQLCETFEECIGVAWVPAGVAHTAGSFYAAIDRWLEGGTIPTNLVVALRSGIDNAVESRGLAWFTGQEVRIEPIVAEDTGQARLLASRLVENLIHRGKLEAPEQTSAPDGRTLRLEPSANGRFVRVWLA